MIGSLGDLVFSVNAERVLTYDDLGITQDARWATHEVHGKTPVSEFVGPGKRKVSLKVKLSVYNRVNVQEQLATIRGLAEAGIVNNLVLGGLYIGRFYVESYSRADSKTDGRGELAISDVTLNLAEF